MPMARSLIFTLALIAAMPSWAVVTDEAISNVITQHQQAVKHYARAQNKTEPLLMEYKYGMQLDVARVIRVSPDLRACKVVPKLMTYEDSNGQLKTLKYQVMSACSGRN